MNRRALQVFVVFAVLVGVTAALLVRVRSNYVLGQPGVKIGNVPMYMLEDGLSNIVSETSVLLPETVLGFEGLPLSVTRQELQMLPPDTVYGRRLYRSKAGEQLMINVVLMGTDRTSIHKPEYCLIGQGETIVGRELITVPMEKPHRYDLQLMKLTTSSEKRMGDGRVIPLRGLFLYWFVADGQLTARHGERMWLMGRDLLARGLLQRWAYVAYWGKCIAGQEDVLLERMKEFIAASAPEFQITAGAPVQSAAFQERPVEMAGAR